MTLLAFDRREEFPANTRVLLYGTGSFAIQTFNEVSNRGIRVVAFGDTFRKSEFLGLPTWGPQRIRGEQGQFDVIIIASQYWREIVSTLSLLGDFDMRVCLPSGDQIDETQTTEPGLNQAQTSLKLQILQTRVMAIFYWGRSGTVFLQSLLDNHPETLMFPVTSLFYFHSQQWDQISHPQVSTAVEQFNLFAKINAGAFDGKVDDSHYALDQLGPKRDICLNVDAQKFMETALEMTQLFQKSGKPLSRKLFFLIAHYAYAQASDQDLTHKNLIVYPLHDPENYRELHQTLNDFPYLLGIGMIRHPFRTYYSHLRHWVFRKNQESDGGKAQLQDLVENGVYLRTFRHLLIGWKNISSFFNKGIWVLKLEDLHANPKDSLTALTQHIEISWHPHLLESTVNGHQYWSDGSSKTNLQGFSAKENKISDWRKTIGVLERILIRGLLDSQFSSYADSRPSWYSKFLFPLALIWPSKLERKAYLCYRKISEKRRRILLNYGERILSGIKIYLGEEEFSAIGPGRANTISDFVRLKAERAPKSNPDGPSVAPLEKINETAK